MLFSETALNLKSTERATGSNPFVEENMPPHVTSVESTLRVVSCYCNATVLYAILKMAAEQVRSCLLTARYPGILGRSFFLQQQKIYKQKATAGLGSKLFGRGERWPKLPQGKLTYVIHNAIIVTPPLLSLQRAYSRRFLPPSNTSKA